MTSRSSFDPFREWTVNGEKWGSLHPLILAMRDFGLIRHGYDGIRDTERRMAEFRSHERELSDALAERVLEIDAEQRRNGYPDDTTRDLLNELRGFPRSLEPDGSVVSG